MRRQDHLHLTEDDDSNFGTARRLGARIIFGASRADGRGESWLFTDWAPPFLTSSPSLTLYDDAKNTRSRSSCIPDDIGQAKLLRLDFKNVEIELIQVPDELSQPKAVLTTRTSQEGRTSLSRATGRGRPGHEHV